MKNIKENVRKPRKKKRESWEMFPKEKYDFCFRVTGVLNKTWTTKENETSDVVRCKAMETGRQAYIKMEEYKITC